MKLRNSSPLLFCLVHYLCSHMAYQALSRPSPAANDKSQQIFLLIHLTSFYKHPLSEKMLICGGFNANN